MTGVFLKIVNMSISAGWLVLAVLVVRLVLKKAPKWVSVLLWGIVALRLVCPMPIESALSLIPSAETIPQEVLSGPSFDLHTGIPHVDAQLNDYLGDRYFEGVTVPTSNGARTMTTLTVVWLIGAASLLFYMVVSFRSLRKKVAAAVLLRENIYRSEVVVSPFVLGILRPKIYLPLGLDGEVQSYVLFHERVHIRRRDHWWKPFGFLLLAVYWFNPLMWLAYVLLCRDIELACDEKVIRELGSEQRADYTEALVACSVNRRAIAACPLAFGEVGVKARVKSVLHYRKPAFWIILLSVAVCSAVAVCFLTDPVTVENRQETELDPSVTGLVRQQHTEDRQEGQPKEELPALPLKSETIDPSELDYWDVELQIWHEMNLLISLRNAESQPGMQQRTYDKLLAYREHTLRYCFYRFIGIENNFKNTFGSISHQVCQEELMVELCRDIAADMGEELPKRDPDVSGLFWFKEVRDRALTLCSQYTKEELKEQYPASYLLLQVLGKIRERI